MDANWRTSPLACMIHFTHKVMCKRYYELRNGDADDNDEESQDALKWLQLVQSVIVIENHYPKVWYHNEGNDNSDDEKGGKAGEKTGQDDGAGASDDGSIDASFGASFDSNLVGGSARRNSRRRSTIHAAGNKAQQQQPAGSGKGKTTGGGSGQKDASRSTLSASAARREQSSGSPPKKVDRRQKRPVTTPTKNDRKKKVKSHNKDMWQHMGEWHRKVGKELSDIDGMLDSMMPLRRSMVLPSTKGAKRHGHGQDSDSDDDWDAVCDWRDPALSHIIVAEYIVYRSDIREENIPKTRTGDLLRAAWRVRPNAPFTERSKQSIAAYGQAQEVVAVAYLTPSMLFDVLNDPHYRPSRGVIQKFSSSSDYSDSIQVQWSFGVQAVQRRTNNHSLRDRHVMPHEKGLADCADLDHCSERQCSPLALQRVRLLMRRLADELATSEAETGRATGNYISLLSGGVTKDEASGSDEEAQKRRDARPKWHTVEIGLLLKPLTSRTALKCSTYFALQYCYHIRMVKEADVRQEHQLAETILRSRHPQGRAEGGLLAGGFASCSYGSRRGSFTQDPHFLHVDDLEKQPRSRSDAASGAQTPQPHQNTALQQQNRVINSVAEGIRTKPARFSPMVASLRRSTQRQQYAFFKDHLLPMYEHRHKLDMSEHDYGLVQRLRTFVDNVDKLAAQKQQDRDREKAKSLVAVGSVAHDELQHEQEEERKRKLRAGVDSRVRGVKAWNDTEGVPSAFRGRALQPPRMIGGVVDRRNRSKTMLLVNPTESEVGKLERDLFRHDKPALRRQRKVFVDDSLLVGGELGPDSGAEEEEEDVQQQSDDLKEFELELSMLGSDTA